MVRQLCKYSILWPPGQACAVRIGIEATWNDLAEILVKHHGFCRHVLIVLPYHGVVTPWECSRLVVDCAVADLEV